MARAAHDGVTTTPPAYDVLIREAEEWRRLHGIDDDLSEDEIMAIAVAEQAAARRERRDREALMKRDASGDSAQENG